MCNYTPYNLYMDVPDMGRSKIRNQSVLNYVALSFLPELFSDEFCMSLPLI